MYYVYFLQSKCQDFVYIGSTSNLKKRFHQHNLGQVQSTKPYIPFRIIYYEAFLDRRDAIKREHKLKHHGSAIGHLKKRLTNSLS